LYATGKIILCGCCPAAGGVARATGLFGRVSARPPGTPNPKQKKKPQPVNFLIKNIEPTIKVS
ncbi:hypothetical protein ACVGXS_04520, partial [Enterobacter hormaechei]